MVSEIITIGDFRETKCPDGTALVFTDPPYGIGKNYQGDDDARPYQDWVGDILGWSTAGWTLILGPPSTMREWLHLVPEPDHMLWWHRTFLLPGRKLSFFAPSITPVLVYRRGGQWYGPDRQRRDTHNVIDSHSSLGDVSTLRSLGVPKPKHPAVTGTQFPGKVLPWLTVGDDLVVDPMAGRGSVLVAAQRLGRRVWGCEVEPVYADAANFWLKAERARLEAGMSGVKRQG